jgi:HisJ family histidinol phosphate phosphatase
MPMDLHMHSNYSDGKNTPEEMIEAAIQIGYDAVALTDHVWKTSSWVPAYAEHLERLKVKYKQDIRIYSGIEAKVLSLEGDIDADASFFPLVDLVLGSIHRIPKPDGFYSKADAPHISPNRLVEHWLTAFSRMLCNPKVDIIAHPLSELKGFAIDVSRLPIKEIAERIADSGKILEINVRYNTLEQPIIRQAIARGVPLLVSSDSHSVADLIRNSALVKELTGKGLPLADIHRYIDGKKRNSSMRGGHFVQNEGE